MHADKSWVRYNKIVPYHIYIVYSKRSCVPTIGSGLCGGGGRRSGGGDRILRLTLPIPTVFAVNAQTVDLMTRMILLLIFMHVDELMC